MPFDASNDIHAASITLDAYLCTDAGAALVHGVQGQGSLQGTLHGGGLMGAARLGAEAIRADIVIAEIGQTSIETACDCVAELARSRASVIVIGTAEDLATYRALTAAGAHDYFPLGTAVDDIVARLPDPSKTTELTPDTRPAPQQGLSVGVTGSAGGVGASLLAQNLAALASRAGQTALLDADLEYGTQAIDLNRAATPGLVEALSAPARVDATFLTATMEAVSDTLHLYSSQERLGADRGPDHAALGTRIPALAQKLRSEFSAVITDLPRHQLRQGPELARALDALVMVVPPGFAGVIAANRMIEDLRADSPTLRILPVLSQHRSDARLSQREVAQALKLPFVAVLPPCGPALAKAHRAAQPLILYRRRSPWAKPVAALWTAINTEQSKQPRRTFLWRAAR